MLRLNPPERCCRARNEGPSAFFGGDPKLSHPFNLCSIHFILSTVMICLANTRSSQVLITVLANNV